MFPGLEMDNVERINIERNMTREHTTTHYKVKKDNTHECDKVN